MNVARAGFSGYGWSDFAFSRKTMGKIGASADDLMSHGTDGTLGDMVMGGPTAIGALALPQNNLTEADRAENTGDAGKKRFVYSYPRKGDRADWDGRRVCTRTGFIAAGRDIVYVDGAPYIKCFAPKHGLAEKLGGSY